MTVWAIAGVVAGGLSIIDAVPYVRDMLRGTTRPQRGTWGIWSVLGMIAFVSQFADGARWSLVMLGIQAASVTVVFVLSLSRGVGGFGLFDLSLISVASVGVVGWLVSARPMVAIACVVVADLAGALLMLPKTWRDPGSETPSSFLLAGASGVLGTIAVGALEPGLLLYPAYFGLINTGTAAVILVRRRPASAAMRACVRAS